MHRALPIGSLASADRAGAGQEARHLDHLLPRALKRQERALERFRMELPDPSAATAGELDAAQRALRGVIEARNALRGTSGVRS